MDLKKAIQNHNNAQSPTPAEVSEFFVSLDRQLKQQMGAIKYAPSHPVRLQGSGRPYRHEGWLVAHTGEACLDLWVPGNPTYDEYHCLSIMFEEGELNAMSSTFLQSSGSRPTQKWLPFDWARREEVFPILVDWVSKTATPALLKLVGLRDPAAHPAAREADPTAPQLGRS